MKHPLRFLLSLSLPVLCLATQPDPRAAFCGVLDPLARLAASRSQNSAVAIDVLKLIALDHADEIAPDAAQKVGLPQFYLQDGHLKPLEARECAIQKIGETALPEAVDFLKTLDRADLGTDEQTVMLLRVAGHVAVRIATLRQIQDPQRQIEYLELTADEMAGSGLGAWAANELCDRASLNSLAVIEKAFREAWSGQYGEEQVTFCKARIFTLYGKPDRVKALAAVLNVETGAQNAQLATWAIHQLALIHAPAADAELARFAKEIDALPSDSSLKERLLPVRLAIPGVPRPRL